MDSAISTTRSGRVAVVDDEPMIGDVVQRTLRKVYEVSLFEGEGGLVKSLSEGQRYDLILCDLFLAGSSGRGVFERLHAEWPDQAERIVFMSGVSSEEEWREIVGDLGREFLKKPFSLEALRDLADRYVAAAQG